MKATAIIEILRVPETGEIDNLLPIPRNMYKTFRRTTKSDKGKPWFNGIRPEVGQLDSYAYVQVIKGRGHRCLHRPGTTGGTIMEK